MDTRRMSLRLQRLAEMSASAVIVLALGLQFLQPTASLAASGSDQANTGTAQTGVTVSSTGNSGPKIAVCVGCNVTQILENQQTVNAVGIPISLGVPKSTKQGRIFRTRKGKINFCSGCAVTPVIISSETVTGP